VFTLAQRQLSISSAEDDTLWALSRTPSMRHPAVPDARVLRTVVLHLADASQGTCWKRVQDTDTGV